MPTNLDYTTQSSTSIKETCSKCGSENLSVTFLEKGETFDKSLSRSLLRKNRYINGTEFVDNTFNLVKKDCLAYFCRNCQYTWETDPKS